MKESEAVARSNQLTPRAKLTDRKETFTALNILPRDCLSYTSPINR